MQKKDSSSEKNRMKTSRGLRDTLLDEIKSLRKNKSTPVRGRAVANLANAVLRSVELELEANRYLCKDGVATEKVKIPEISL
jgi:hypothetical protein